MNLKSLTIGAAIAVVALGAFSSAAVASPRGYHQERAIRHGIATGQLTHREAHRLMWQQRRIERAAYEARADGYVSHRERRQLHRMRDEAAYDIQRQMHDRQTRWR
jgi:hypothetical protein